MRCVFSSLVLTLLFGCLSTAEPKRSLNMVFQGSQEQISQNSYLAEWMGQQLTDKHSIEVQFSTNVSPNNPAIIFSYRNQALKEFPISALSDAKSIEGIINQVEKAYAHNLKRAELLEKQRAAEAELAALLREEKLAPIRQENQALHNARAYGIIDLRKNVPAAFLHGSYSTAEVPAQQVLDDTRKILLERLRAKGLPPAKLSEAVITGVFTPDLRDLRLLWMGCQLPSKQAFASNMPQYKEDIKDLLRDAFVRIREYDHRTDGEPTDYHASKVTAADINGISDFQYRTFWNLQTTRRWKRFYGELSPTGQYDTVFFGKKVRLTPIQINQVNTSSLYIHFAVKESDYKMVQELRAD